MLQVGVGSPIGMNTQQQEREERCSAEPSWSCRLNVAAHHQWGHDPVLAVGEHLWLSSNPAFPHVVVHHIQDELCQVCWNKWRRCPSDISGLFQRWNRNWEGDQMEKRASSSSTGDFNCLPGGSGSDFLLLSTSVVTILIINGVI